MTPIEHFLQQASATCYPEPVTDGHSMITSFSFGRIRDLLPINAEVLDVGCGQGPALDLFRKYGFQAIGIDVNEVNLAACREAGHFVYHMDQNQLTLQDNKFDLVWARHVLEHSPIPFWTLHEFHRVLKPNSILYVEVPAPDTSCHHETNMNHYSCLTYSTWVSLIGRVGFGFLEARKIPLTTPVGTDEYWSFVCKKGNV